ncbi:MAG: ANTAR domain-containing protein [Lachnospiraceae bacterium]|nr:ANTAR domain-containing protein [Lachnospiraceae bacterium]MDE7274655.1 ANTAR domain-containing protein [Lachnospiraceae bacterium]
MTNIIVAFARIEDARSIKNILVKNGFGVTAVCTSGAQALGYADEFHDGIVIAGYRLTDMLCVALKENLPGGFEMVVMASQRVLTDELGSGITGLAMPIKVHELVNTVDMLSQGIVRRRKKQREKPRVRDGKEAAIIEKAKQQLITGCHMTEEEAHRYLQKHSMDNGTNMVETAQMVLAMK